MGPLISSRFIKRFLRFSFIESPISGESGVGKLPIDRYGIDFAKAGKRLKRGIIKTLSNLVLLKKMYSKYITVTDRLRAFIGISLSPNSPRINFLTSLFTLQYLFLQLF
jgi:hypothetical protein